VRGAKYKPLDTAQGFTFAVKGDLGDSNGFSQQLTAIGNW